MYVDESPVRSDFLNPETPSMTKVSYTAGVTNLQAWYWTPIRVATVFL